MDNFIHEARMVRLSDEEKLYMREYLRDYVRRNDNIAVTALVLNKTTAFLMLFYDMINKYGKTLVGKKNY